MPGLNSSTRLRENGSDSTSFHQGSTKKQIAVWSSLSCFSLYCVKRVTVHQFSLYCVKRGVGLTVHFPRYCVRHRVGLTVHFRAVIDIIFI